MDDRTRAQATIYLLKYEKPDLILLHFVDLDSEAHENGTFTREANAKLEYTDELIGQMLAATPPQMAVAIVSGHGFERADKVVDVNQVLAREGVRGSVEMRFGYLTTNDEAVAGWLRAASRESKFGIGREIPKEEVRRFAPESANALAAFEVDRSLRSTAARRMRSSPHGPLIPARSLRKFDPLLSTRRESISFAFRSRANLCTGYRTRQVVLDRRHCS